MTIKPKDLDAAIMDILNNMSTEIKAKVYQSALEVGKDVSKDLKKNSPEDQGKYAKSWGVVTVLSKTGGKTVIVRNKKYYRLTHLLEFGHVNRDGSRARAFPHISKANDKAIKEFEQKVEAEISHDL